MRRPVAVVVSVVISFEGAGVDGSVSVVAVASDGDVAWLWDQYLSDALKGFLFFRGLKTTRKVCNTTYILLCTCT